MRGAEVRLGLRLARRGLGRRRAAPQRRVGAGAQLAREEGEDDEEERDGARRERAPRGHGAMVGAEPKSRLRIATLSELSDVAPTLPRMTPRTKKTAAALGGALVLASGAYALGSQAGDGAALAGGTSASSSQQAGRPFGPGPPPPPPPRPPRRPGRSPAQTRAPPPGRPPPPP